MENASSKVVFRLSHEDNLRAMAQWLFMGVMNPDEIKHELYSTKVMEYREELRTSYSSSQGKGQGGGAFSGVTAGASEGGSTRDGDPGDLHSWNTYTADSQGTSNTWATSEAQSQSESSMLIPVFGKELSHVQFRSLEEQLFRAMAVLFDQQERQGVARLVGMNAPVSIFTPTVTKPPQTAERTKRFLTQCYEKSGFALPLAEAKKQMSERSEQFIEELLKQAAKEPTDNRRRIR